MNRKFQSIAATVLFSFFMTVAMFTEAHHWSPTTYNADCTITGCKCHKYVQRAPGSWNCICGHLNDYHKRRKTSYGSSSSISKKNSHGMSEGDRRGMESIIFIWIGIFVLGISAKLGEQKKTGAGCLIGVLGIIFLLVGFFNGI